MQCYEKSPAWSACKSFCRPGKDPYDTDQIPWSCKELGDRTESVGYEETCNPGRAGSEFWDGKVLHRSQAKSEAACNEECGKSDDCTAWSWQEAVGAAGQCLLSGTVKTSDGAPAWACRFSATDLPQSCSASGQDCAHTHCCSKPGERCLQREDGQVATCSTSCPGSKEREQHQQQEQEPATQCRILGPTFCPACGPLRRSRPELVMPTFERDLCKALVVLKSLTKHDPDNLVGDVHVLWVSKEPVWKYQDKIDEMRAEVEKTRSFTVHDFSTQLLSPAYPCLAWKDGGTECVVPMQGWYAQMALKLKIAFRIKSDYYLLVDSKNAFFDDVREDTFFDTCNRARVLGKYPSDQIPEPHDRWYNKSAEFLQMPIKAKWLPASITPALMSTKVVLDMLKHIGEKADPSSICDGPLCRLFGSEATEFAMYNIFSLGQESTACYHNLERPADHEQPWSAALWRASKDNAQTCEDVASGSLRPLTFGIQSRSLDLTIEGAESRGLSVLESASLKERLQRCITKVYARNGLYDESIITAGAFVDCVS